MMVTAYIGLGANLDDPASQVRLALEELEKLPESKLLGRSSLYVSAPMGYENQPDFINAAVAIQTRLSPRSLLSELLDIEHHHGRNRSFRNAPRTLDLDLLLYGNAHFHEEGLTLPHPRMHERAFVLLPLMELSPDLAIPGRGRLDMLLGLCADQNVRRITDNPLLTAGGVV
jgi:2-amino-4-hydroxy-6-hydroxymethyldihydropteridine diphosphokinase